MRASRAKDVVREEPLPLLLLTAQQVAQMCQVSLDKVYEWTYAPGFPAIVSPHYLRIHAGLLDDWLQSRATGRSAEDDGGNEPRPTEEAA